MTRTAAACVALLVTALSSAIETQAPPDLSGSWALQAPAGGRGGRGNFAGYATASKLVITQSATEISMQTDTAGQMQTTVYRLDGSEQPVPGPLGWDTKASARWDNGRLTVAIKRSIDGPEGRLNFDIRDVYSLAGDVLTLQRSQGTRTQTMTYKRS